MPAGPIQSIPNMKVNEIAGSRPEGALKANPNAIKFASGEGKTNYSSQGRTLARADGIVVGKNIPPGQLMRADGGIVARGGGGTGMILAKANPLGHVVGGGGTINIASKATSALVKNPNAGNLRNGGVLVKADAEKAMLAKNPNISTLARNPNAGILEKSTHPMIAGAQASLLSSAQTKYSTLFGSLQKKL
jgi:hypothetical protein